MGVGAAFVMPATLSIINAVFPVRERAAAIGAWSGVAGLGVVAGLLNHFSWGSVFWLNVPLVAAAILAALIVVPDLPGNRTDGRLDVLGALLSAVGLVAIVDAVIEGPDRGWTSAATLAVAGTGLAMMIGFVVRELTAKTRCSTSGSSATAPSPPRRSPSPSQCSPYSGHCSHSPSTCSSSRDTPPCLPACVHCPSLPE